MGNGNGNEQEAIDRIARMIDEAVAPSIAAGPRPMWPWWRPLARAIVAEIVALGDTPSFVLQRAKEAGVGNEPAPRATSASGSGPITEQGEGGYPVVPEFSLLEHLDACLVIADRIERGTNGTVDDLTLISHLRVMREDLLENRDV